MTKSNTHETDVHDLSLDVMDALDRVDVKALSYIQLRRLCAALTRALADMARETELRSKNDTAGDTVRVPIPSKQKQNS